MRFKTLRAMIVRPILAAGVLLALLSAGAVVADFVAPPGGDRDVRRCYARPGAAGDHVIFGCEVAGYTMRDDPAARDRPIIAMVPRGYKTVEAAPAVFHTTSRSLNGRPLRRLLGDEMKAVMKKKPGARLVRKITDRMPRSMNACVGAELEIPAASDGFTNRIYHICRSGSRRYAILISITARSQQDLRTHYDGFLAWAGVPHVVLDQKPRKVGKNYSS